MKIKYRKGVSPVIAVLLLIAIAVATGILVYVWVTGLTATLTRTGGTQVTEQLTLEAYDYSDTNKLILYLRNTGGTDVTIDTIYVNGSMKDTFTVGTITNKDTVSVSIGEVVKITVYYPAEEGASVIVKVVTKSGAVFSYTVIAGRSG